MNNYIAPSEGLTAAGIDLHDHIAALLTSVATENQIDPITLSYIAHQAIESVTAEMMIDNHHATPTKRIQLFGEVA